MDIHYNQRKPSIIPNRSLVTLFIVCIFLSLGAKAQQAIPPALQPGDYDIRPQLLTPDQLVAPSTQQTQSIQAFKDRNVDAVVDTNPVNGSVSRMRSLSGYLTAPSQDDHDTIARNYLRQYADMMGLTAGDVAILELTDSVDKRSGGKNLYYRQLCRGIPVADGLLQVNFGREHQISAVISNLIPNLCVASLNLAPVMSALDAVIASARQLSLISSSLTPAAQVTNAFQGDEQTTTIEATELSNELVTAELRWMQISNGVVGLMWNFQLLTDEHYLDIYVGADGKSPAGITLMRDWVKQESYRVFPQPLESPTEAIPAPPADGRSLVVNPENALASPNGWFDAGTSIMDGNNVRACADANGNNACDAGQPVCSGSPLVCDFNLNLSQAPASSIAAAITNLFYWNNLVHDTQYQYGFTESAGNFQESNFGRGGAGSDSVNADAQDGSGNCNANFSAPPDGLNPRMQMFTCNNSSPSRDGDFDAGVVVHEYGHGISVRQVGGPGNSSCLGNIQQAGEGWSDFFSLVYTAKPGDQGGDARGVGSYLFNLNPNGGTIRDLPYSTDPAINNWTYESIAGAAVPHGVGSRWAQAIWEVYWALVDKHGFNPDLQNPGNFDAGNQRALLYVNEGLQNTACSPTFIDNRDGVIQAAMDNFGGADVCTVWEAFAGFGLGVDASTAGPNSRSASNGFNVPASCQCSPQAIASAGPDVTVCPNTPTLLGTAALPGHSYQWFPGGQTTAQITESPLVTTTYTIDASTSCGIATDSVTITVSDSNGGNFNDDFEGDNSDWTSTGLWHPATNSACASPNAGFVSPVSAFYYGQESSCNYNTGSANSGSLTSPIITDITANTTLNFNYLREVESFNGNFDITTVEVVSASGATTVFSLNATNASANQWLASGDIDLSAFAGEAIQLRFTFNSGDATANNQIGWFIDDVVVTNEPLNCNGPVNTPPSVSISNPTDGTSIQIGTALNFVASATDIEDGDLTTSISWDSDIDGNLGFGGSISALLSFGTHRVTASASDIEGLNGIDEVTINVTDAPPPPGNGSIDWNSVGTVSYSNQDNAGNFTILDGGSTLLLQDNTWRRTTDFFNITANTVIEFDFSSTEQGEIHGIGFDENDLLVDLPRIFQIYGDQNWTGALANFGNSANGYTGSGDFEPFQINVGASYTGNMALVLVNDDDAGIGSNNGRFRNLAVRQCSSIDNFEDGAEGWTNNSVLSTCSTGSFVVGTPTQIVAGGITTQLAGDHSIGSGDAFFSAPNSSAGNADVDGGVCVADSSPINVTADSDVSIWYYHGQRDAGDDPGGDFFSLEAAVDGGAFVPLVGIGDVSTNAQWQKASLAANAGQTVQFRVRVSDGAATGDLIEAGVDDIMVCPTTN